MTHAFVAILVLFLGVFTPTEAQDQSGSVEIAKSAAPTDILTNGAVECFTTVSQKLSAEKATEFCLKAAKLEARRGEKIANEAADATKASRPLIILSDRFSYGRSGYYGRSGFGVGVGVRIGSNRRVTSRHRTTRPRTRDHDRRRW